ncbi:MAG: glutamine--tRNA ligase/YqeY domain fusion protein [Clostridia bacterium]|nr:glutamine--tRNA ligase/YqeY domain fusion protein [Clostridia bacterium]
METIEPINFIEEIINNDIQEGKCKAIQTRHPPEPSGYLHIGHVRNIVLNYGTAKRYGGVCNLRYDDTNPEKESQEFVDAIQNDVKWLGYEWNEIHYATEYFQQNYEIAVKLIKEGKAYVCDLSAEELSKTRGTLTEPGMESPYRNRSVEENLDLFERMKNGEFPEGSRVLRAKIDMASPNMNMRDPWLYKIQYKHHHRIGDSWKIYPSYDFSHPLDDCLEGVTHSICGPEFEDHRPLYNWVVENSGLKNKSRQVEYPNVYVKGAILGKRNIKKLVNEGRVSGFDDPRLYTLAGLRRRGVLPESLVNFIYGAGLSKVNNAVFEQAYVEHYIRETLNQKARRVMAVLDGVKLVITNFEGEEQEVYTKDYPQIEGNTQTHKHYFAKELLVERADFMKEPAPKFHRLYVGNEVRLSGAYIIKCTGFDEDENGNVTTIYAEYDPNTLSGTEGANRKVKGTIHWVNPAHCQKVECRLYENLVMDEDSEAVEALEADTDGIVFNPNSLTVLENAYVEDIDFNEEERYQFVRNGYFALDKDSTQNKLVFNRTITLKETKKAKI